MLDVGREYRRAACRRHERAQPRACADLVDRDAVELQRAQQRRERRRRRPEARGQSIVAADELEVLVSIAIVSIDWGQSAASVQDSCSRYRPRSPARRRRRAEPHSPPPACRAFWVAGHLPLRPAQPQARPRARAKPAAQARRMAPLLLLRGRLRLLRLQLLRRWRGRCRRASGVQRAAARLALQARRQNWSLRRATGKGLHPARVRSWLGLAPG